MPGPMDLSDEVRSLAARIQRGLVVPVLGPELIWSPSRKDYLSCIVTSQILDSLKDRYIKEEQTSSYLQSLQSILESEGLSSVPAVLGGLISSTAVSGFYGMPIRSTQLSLVKHSWLLRQISEATTYTLEQTNDFGGDALREFLELSRCTLYITMTWDPVITRLLKNSEVSPEYQSYGFQPIEKGGTQTECPPPTEALVCHLFGQIEQWTSTFAAIESEQFRYCYYLGQSKNIPARVLEEISMKELLFLGCTLENGYMRYLLRVLAQEGLHKGDARFSVVHPAKNRRWVDQHRFYQMHEGTALKFPED